MIPYILHNTDDVFTLILTQYFSIINVEVCFCNCDIQGRHKI